MGMSRVVTRRLAFLAVAALASIFDRRVQRRDEAEAVATTNVRMVKSYRFEPEVIEVDAGSTVTWTNEDNFTHMVQVDGRDDREVGKGESVSIAFDEAGPTTTSVPLHSRDMSRTVIVR